MNKISTHAYITRQHMLKSSYEVFHYLDKISRNIAVHHHDFYELYFFINGNCNFYIEGEIYHMKPGDIVLINSNELHQAKTDQNGENYERIVLWLGKKFLQSFSTKSLSLESCFESLDKPCVINTDFESRRDIHCLLDRIVSLQKFDGKGGDILGKAYIMELMVKISNNIRCKEKSVYTYMKNSVLIDRIIDHIEVNLNEDISLDALSSMFFLSKYHLSREFKKYTNVTLHRYIKLKRLIRAKERILQNERITDVSAECGFGDYSNFFRAFKNEYGMTPKQFYKIMVNKI